MYVAVNTIETENVEHLKGMFKMMAPNLKQFEGFLGFELWEEGGKLLAVSRWEDKDSFEKYLHSEVFASHHGGASGRKMQSQAQVTFYQAEKIV